jgi:hypothetical protein
LLSASGLLYGQTIDPSVAPLTVIPPASGPNPYEELPLDDGAWLAPSGEMFLEPVCDAPVVQTPRSRFAFDFTLADFEIDDGEARYWTTDPTTVSRGELAFEGESGLGLRGVFWSLDRQYRSVDDEDDRLDVRIATYYLDGYRRFYGERGELLLGGGLAGGNLKFDSPYVDSPRRFNGIGGSLVAEGFYPFLRFEKTDIGLTGRARLAVLGPTEDNLDGSQAMLVDELGVGVELRRRWGEFEDKLWFIRVGREWQHWSDADTPFSVDQRLEGTSFLLGFAW